MHHSLNNVASNRFLEPVAFKKFALENRDKFSVTGSDDHPAISTFYVDDLVDAFKESLGDKYLEQRGEQIELARGRMR